MADHFMELLCPAGNMDKLKMAIRYGADAVYCAGKRFGLRAGNSNFSDEELKELLLDHSQIANKVNQMITRANEYGGKDNISLVIVDLKR